MILIDIKYYILSSFIFVLINNYINCHNCYNFNLFIHFNNLYPFNPT